MATETNNTAAAADTKSEHGNYNETLSPTTLDASAPASENLTAADPPASGEAMNGDSKAKEAQCERNDPADDVEKKIRRAERFGVPLKLSEHEKLSSRAERFGKESGPCALKSSEEQKRKSRAERFGLEANSAVDNEEKKKARLARFGSNTKIDSQEEEKRKARALRFAQSPADSQTHTDREATQKTAVTGNAIGGI